MWARSMGYRWATLQLDGFNNAPRWHTFRQACHNNGILAGPWFTEGGNVALTPIDSDFTIAEMEGPGDYDGIIASIPSLPDIPRAIVTNFGTPLTNAQGVYQRDKAAPLVAAGFGCLTEAYLNESPNLTPDRLDWTAKVQLGFPWTQPVFGVYGSATLADYEQWQDWPGWSVYLSEYLP